MGVRPNFSRSYTFTFTQSRPRSLWYCAVIFSDECPNSCWVLIPCASYRRSDSERCSWKVGIVFPLSMERLVLSTASLKETLRLFSPTWSPAFTFPLDVTWWRSHGLTTRSLQRLITCARLMSSISLRKLSGIASFTPVFCCLTCRYPSQTDTSLL